MAIRQDIENHFNTQWASQTKIAWDNVPFDPEGETEFVRFSFQRNGGSQETLGDTGNRLFRHFGILFIQVFVQRKIATKRADELADNALNIFEGNTILGVRFINCRKVDVPIHEPEWFQINVICDFNFDIIK